MRLLLSIILLLLLFSTRCLAAEDLCFKAIQDGQEVKTICAGSVVSFKNCSIPTPNDATVLFYVGPKSEINENSKTLDEGETVLLQEIKTYTITLILTRSGRTDFFEQKFEVKKSQDIDFDVKFCAERKMQVEIADQGYDYYLLDFKDGSTIKRAVKGETVEHTHLGSGKLEVVITGFYNGTTLCTSPTVSYKTNALPVYSPPTINSLLVKNQNSSTGSLKFTFNNLLEGYIYTLNRKLETENGSSKIATLPAGQTDFELNNTNTAIPAIYKIDVTDACGNKLGSSNSITSIVLQASPANGFNSVAWKPTGGFERVSIYRDGALLPVANPTSAYEDKAVKCGTEYTYQVWGESGNGAVVSKSVVQTVTTSSTIKPPVGKLWVSYNLSNQVELQFTPPAGETVREVNFFRAFGNNKADRLNTIYNTLEYQDKLEKPVAVCYSATYKNECVLSDLTPSVCPILLMGQQASNGSYLLSWTAYVGFAEGISGYVVELLDENNQIISEYPVNTTTFTDNNTQVARYRIKVISNSGETSYSNLVEVEKLVQLHVPSGFTPNQDGLNDVFEVKGKFIKTYSIRIFNGMGQVVYTSTNREGSWDGTYKGTPLPVGAYAYEIVATSESNKTKRRTGTITLLR